MALFDENHKFYPENGLQPKWKEGKYFEIKNSDMLLTGHIAYLIEDDKTGLLENNQYFHLQDLKSNSIETKKKLLKFLVEELKRKNVHYIFFPTNEKDSLDAFIVYFRGRVIFHRDFDVEHIDENITKNPEKAFNILCLYEKDFKNKIQQGLENLNNYQPPYFYVGANINILDQKIN